MKKNRFIKIVILAIMFFGVSCTDQLDETPLSSLSPDNLFTSVKDVETAITGMYAGFTPYLSVLTPVRGWGEMGTDTWGRDAVDVKFARYTYTSADAEVLQAWSNLYSIINRANNIIANVPKVDASETDQKRYMAEAYCIRAFCYMDLVQYFGGVPLRLKPTSSIEEALSLARSTEKETYAQIFSDLEYAEQNLPAKAAVGRVSKWTAKGLIAKAYLTRGGYPAGNYSEPEWFQKAAAKAYEVISGSGIVLNPTTASSPGAFKEYGKMFLESGKNSPESLWEIQFLDPDYGSAFGWRGPNGGLRWDNSVYGNYNCQWGGTLLGSDFALSYNDDDIRFKWSIGPFTLNATSSRTGSVFNGWAPYKYRWERIPGNVWNSAVNLIVLRMADVYLIYAEASNEATGDPNNSSLGMSAYAAINVVRKRAQVTLLDDAYLLKNSPYTTSELLYNMSLKSFDKADPNYDKRHVYYAGNLKERFRAAVLMERGWELMMERHRWFDLKRTGKLIEFCKNTHILEGGQLAATALADPIDKSNWNNAAAMPKLGSRVWPSAIIQPHQIYMPIPNTEITINPAMKGAQNPGY